MPVEFKTGNRNPYGEHTCNREEGECKDKVKLLVYEDFSEGKELIFAAKFSHNGEDIILRTYVNYCPFCGYKPEENK